MSPPGSCIFLGLLRIHGCCYQLGFQLLRSAVVLAWLSLKADSAIDPHYAVPPYSAKDQHQKGDIGFHRRIFYCELCQSVYLAFSATSDSGKRPGCSTVFHVAERWGISAEVCRGSAVIVSLYYDYYIIAKSHNVLIHPITHCSKS